jgi:spore coat protein SA
MGSFLVMPLYDHIECEVAEKSDGLIFIHGSVKREVEVITHNKLCRNMCIIHNGVDAKNFKPRDVSELKHKYGLSEKDKVLLFVGRLEPLKGVHTFIRVAKRLSRDHPSLKIMIVGDGHPSYIRVLKELAKSKDNFIFTGWVEHDKLPEIYCLADIFVSPSPYSSGNNLLEAMACGKPVVAVRGLGFEELIEHGKTGFIVDSINIEYNLERCLRSVLYNEELLSHIGKNARSFVEENLSWEKTALKTVKFIQLLLKGEQLYEEDISLAPN